MQVEDKKGRKLLIPKIPNNNRVNSISPTNFSLEILPRVEPSAVSKSILYALIYSLHPAEGFGFEGRVDELIASVYSEHSTRQTENWNTFSAGILRAFFFFGNKCFANRYCGADGLPKPPEEIQAKQPSHYVTVYDSSAPVTASSESTTSYA